MKNPYKRIGKRYAHRVIWERANGPIPAGMMVDHINGDKHDNRIENLRLVTPGQNNWNQRRLKGYRVTPSGTFMARITVNKRTIYLGIYSTKEEAQRAYFSAKQRYHKL